MMQRMTNPKQNKDFVCLTWARWPRVTVCRVGSASRWFKFLLEEEAITNGKQSNVMCCWLIIHQVTDVMRLFRFPLKWCVRVCVPLCPVCAGCRKSVIGPWDWTCPAPGYPGCDVEGHGQKNYPSNYAVPPWPTAALPPVTNNNNCDVIFDNSDIAPDNFDIVIHNCDCVCNNFDLSYNFDVLS